MEINRKFFCSPKCRKNYCTHKKVHTQYLNRRIEGDDAFLHTCCESHAPRITTQDRQKSNVIYQLNVKNKRTANRGQENPQRHNDICRHSFCTSFARACRDTNRTGSIVLPKSGLRGRQSTCAADREPSDCMSPSVMANKVLNSTLYCRCLTRGASTGLHQSRPQTLWHTIFWPHQRNKR